MACKKTGSLSYLSSKLAIFKMSWNILKVLPHPWLIMWIDWRFSKRCSMSLYLEGLQRGGGGEGDADERTDRHEGWSIDIDCPNGQFFVNHSLYHLLNNGRWSQCTVAHLVFVLKRENADIANPLMGAFEENCAPSFQWVPCAWFDYLHKYLVTPQSTSVEKNKVDFAILFVTSLFVCTQCFGMNRITKYKNNCFEISRFNPFKNCGQANKCHSTMTTPLGFKLKYKFCTFISNNQKSNF